MIFDGRCIQCSMLEEGIAELRFDRKEDSVNKFDQEALKELAQALDLLCGEADLRGLLISSGKDAFIVGADVTEFLGRFGEPEETLRDWVLQVDRLFAQVEDLPVPSVAAINGFALGGGLEFALTASYRVMTSAAKIGLPETKLGIIPGWGGTVRLSRLAGADTAIEWIAGGEHHGAEEALKAHVADAVVAPEKLQEAALDLLRQAIEGRRDWAARRTEKFGPLRLNATEARMVFEVGRGIVEAKAGPNYPAPVAAVEAMQKGASVGRDEALAFEAAAFARMAKTPAAKALVTIFLGDQAVAKIAKKAAKVGSPVKKAAVLGAGIMGGGVAYQSASRGIPIVMKDINEGALAQGLAEASKLLEKRVGKGEMAPAKMAKVLGGIRATISYGDCKDADLVVEAVVENEGVKKSVLAELEGTLRKDAVLCSNTSTISITRLAEALKRPENFCGMHFFNPVPRMKLVEVIRGKASSEKAIATAVGYALAMGKTPVVVNDCPGFLVNRVLFPYFGGFIHMVADGVDFQRIDKVMEKFGWPMGPAYLLDVVGIDTAQHCNDVMAQDFSDRLRYTMTTAVQAMYDLKRFGQKNGKGFYAYQTDKKGVLRKAPDPESEGILAPLAKGQVASSDQAIVDRMMLPMVIECARCLEDGIVGTPTEVDIALLYGLGFPAFRGGVLRWADEVGLKALCDRADTYKSLGKLYEPTACMRELAAAGRGFHEER
jgi:3-hydroxyacyl-CoA dehydrogenase/enoyl-CoA hydratase/3-hydroxybutyryl-CoA epimerase/enoyl-CoA isomerase